MQLLDQLRLPLQALESALCLSVLLSQASRHCKTLAAKETQSGFDLKIAKSGKKTRKNEHESHIHKVKRDKPKACSIQNF